MRWQLRAGQAVIGMLAPLVDPELAAALAARGVTAISLDGLPRTLSRAQAMDALSSQANVAGYKAALVAADAYGRFFPLLITAAGTARPAKVLVLGTGVAGLQAIGTARRLGAEVSGYDVRPTSKDEVESLGATFIELTSVGSRGRRGRLRPRADRRGAPGPAGRADRPHRPARRGDHDRAGARAQAAAAGHRGRGQGDGPGLGHRGHGRQRARRQRRPARCPARPWSPATGSRSSGAQNLAATVPTAASNAYSRNISALLLHLITDGALAIDTSDEIQAGVVVAHDGQVVHPAVAKLLRPTEPEPEGGTDVDGPGD